MTWERSAGAGSAAAPERVWSVLLDGRRWSLWNPAVEWMTLEGPPIPGTVVTIKPKRMRQTALRIEQAVEGRLLALVLTFGPLATMRLRWDIAPESGGSSIVQTVAIAGPLANLVLRRAAQRIGDEMQPALQRLAVRATE